jgi:hypothetical protein
MIDRTAHTHLAHIPIAGPHRSFARDKVPLQVGLVVGFPRLGRGHRIWAHKDCRRSAQRVSTLRAEAGPEIRNPALAPQTAPPDGTEYSRWAVWVSRPGSEWIAAGPRAGPWLVRHRF